MLKNLPLPQVFPSVKDVKRLPPTGPWPSKSGGELIVRFGQPLTVSGETSGLNESFFVYPREELAIIPAEMRGLRFYHVRGIPKHGVGGNEFHRLRHELFLATDGALLMDCEDLHGEQEEFRLEPNDYGVWIPPFIMHTVIAREPNSGFLVVCNTLFEPNNPASHDSYPVEEFNHLRRELVKRLAKM